MIADLGRDARAVVGDLDDAPRLRAGALAGGSRLRRSGATTRHDSAAVAGGFGCVGDEVGEDLAQFGGEAFDRQILRQVGGDGDAEALKRRSISRRRSSSMSLRSTGTGALDSR